MIRDSKAANETVKPNEREVAILREHFPGCFRKDGSFDLERFRGLLADKVNVVNEGYELKFLGKGYAKLLAALDTTTVIQPDLEHNQKPEHEKSQNIYISGDNLDGLKHLLKSYARSASCIYIDPPYNTGSDGFVYSDNFHFTEEELMTKLSIGEEQAQRILDLTSRGSSSDSAWLMFMYARLLLARDLLSADGTIFISVDDNEQANLKLIADDIFGVDNFIAQIIVQSNKRGQTYKQLAKTHEYLLVYTRNIDGPIHELMRELGAFEMEDGISAFAERELRNRNPKYGRFNRPNLYYPIYVNPDQTDENGYAPISLERSEAFTLPVYPLNSEGGESCWRWGTAKLEQNSAENSFYSHVVARKKSTGEYGVYEKYRKTTFKAKTIWFDERLTGDLLDEEDDIWDENGVITEQGSVELGAYGMGEVFDFPKPTHFIKKILMLGSERDSLCIDFFSGSATTAEAVMRMNAEQTGGGQRKYILIQLPEDLDEKRKAAPVSDRPKIQKVIDFLDGMKRPHTLDQVGMQRILRAAEAIRKAHPDTQVDLGFQHFTLAEPSELTLDKLEEFDAEAMFSTGGILDEFGKPTVLTTWLVHDGYGFTARPERLDFCGYPAYCCGRHLYLIDPDFSEGALTALVERLETDEGFSPSHVVLLGYSFTWRQSEMLTANLKGLKDTEQNLRIQFDIRY